jgi:bifunctional non-homologous end joining protein LigD
MHHFDEVGLGRDDRVDVLIRHRRLVDDAGVLAALDPCRRRRVILKGEPAHRLRPAHRPAGAVRTRVERAPMPAIISPQLAAPRAAAPAGEDWLHEIKLDGYRTMAYIAAERVRLMTRNGLDWTGYYGDLANAFQDLRCRQAILDGEVVVQDAAGVTSVPALEQALESRRTEQLIFYAFDLLHLDGEDLRPLPLRKRKAALATLLGGPAPNARLQISEHIVGNGPTVLGEVCRMGLEGVVSKRIDAPYQSGVRQPG